MAEETPNPEEKPKSKKPIVMIIVAVVVVLLLVVGAVVGTLFATGQFSHKPPPTADEMLDAEAGGGGGDHGAPAADAHGAPAADAHGAPKADAHGAPAADAHGAPAADAHGAPKKASKDGPGGKMKSKSPELARFEYTYHQLEREFLVNVSGSRKVMSVQLAIMTRYDERVINNVKKHEFAIRSVVMDVMRLTTEADLAKPEFRKDLAVRIRDAMNGLIEKYEDFGGIEEVHFTSFIVQ
ncbi:MAG: flagellar basal body-associated FliL family protein [Comamonadaceae bacterium]